MNTRTRFFVMQNVHTHPHSKVQSYLSMDVFGCSTFVAACKPCSTHVMDAHAPRRYGKHFPSLFTFEPRVSSPCSGSRGDVRYTKSKRFYFSAESRESILFKGIQIPFSQKGNIFEKCFAEI